MLESAVLGLIPLMGVLCCSESSLYRPWCFSKAEADWFVAADLISICVVALLNAFQASSFWAHNMPQFSGC